jgi:hypothetical protein
LHAAGGPLRRSLAGRRAIVARSSMNGGKGSRRTSLAGGKFVRLNLLIAVSWYLKPRYTERIVN